MWSASLRYSGHEAEYHPRKHLPCPCRRLDKLPGHAMPLVCVLPHMYVRWIFGADRMSLTACQCSIQREARLPVVRASAYVPICATELVSLLSFFHGWCGWVGFSISHGYLRLQTLDSRYGVNITAKASPLFFYYSCSVLMCRLDGVRSCIVSDVLQGIFHFMWHIVLSFYGVTSREGPMGDGRIANLPCQLTPIISCVLAYYYYPLGH